VPLRLGARPNNPNVDRSKAKSKSKSKSKSTSAAISPLATTTTAHHSLAHPPAHPSLQAADTQNVCAYVKNLVDQHNMERSDADPGMADVKLVANLTMQIAYKNKDKLSAGMIIGGWDSKRGPQVYGIPLGGSLLPCPFTIGGSGGAYIYGARRRRRDLRAACFFPHYTFPVRASIVPSSLEDVLKRRLSVCLSVCRLSSRALIPSL
jgi:hypothetical protein